MQYVKLFENFEDVSDLRKVGFVFNFGTGKVTLSDENELIEKIIRDIFIPMDDDYKVDSRDIPVYNFGQDDWTNCLIKDKKIAKGNVYNSPDRRQYASDKVKFYKAMSKSEYIPKTVYTLKASESLEFPVIAKPAKGCGGYGIKRFETVEQLQKSKDEFDLYQECIDIDKEYRVIFFDEEILFISERTPDNAKAKSFRNGKGSSAGARNEFVWTSQIISKFAKRTKFKELCQQVMDTTKLDCVGIDIAVDKSGKCWIIEANTTPGLNNDQCIVIYKAMFEKFYGRKMKTADVKTLDMYTKKITEQKNR